MDKRELTDLLGNFSDASPRNRVGADEALRPDLIGMRMYERPLVGVAAAGDPYFLEMRRPEAVGPHFRLPGEWLPGAVSVVSFFAPFTDPVIRSNRSDPRLPSSEWLHARIEGQMFINALCAYLVGVLENAGGRAMAPSLDPGFWAWINPAGRREDGRQVPGFTSNWSERHVAHVAGLGTFGLSAGLITVRGMAGRLGSVITDLPLAADPRPYRGHDDYCNRCGACVRRCVGGAISLASGKDKRICSDVVAERLRQYRPRYGCGKCQTAVPCERGIPPRRVTPSNP